MYDNVDSVISKSGLVENVGLAVDIASSSQAVQKLLGLQFYGRHLGFPVEGDIRFFRVSTIEKSVSENGCWGVDTGFVSLAGLWAKLEVYVIKKVPLLRRGSNQWLMCK